MSEASNTDGGTSEAEAEFTSDLDAFIAEWSELLEQAMREQGAEPAEESAT